MDEFTKRHEAKITGVLSCFDRMVFHGHLGLRIAMHMEVLLKMRGLLVKDFKGFVTQQAERLKLHAQAVAERAGRPYIYLERKERKEDRARAMAKRDGITQGLICVFAAQEPCQSFYLRFAPKRPYLEVGRRKCLFFYYYYLDREFGLMHVRMQSWFPLQIQVCLNGHEWLQRKLDRHGIAYRKVDNAFTWIADPQRAQRLADRMVDKNWPRILDTLARRVNPLMRDLLAKWPYYWVTSQAEFATDVMFKDRAALQGVYPSLLRHSTLCFTPEDILTFLGRKLDVRFAGEVLTDFKVRQPGARVKHRMKENWIKMYDKHGCVLRIETVINHPYEFKTRRSGKRNGEEVLGWYPMPKSVAYLDRYAQVSLQANARYLDALASVEDPTESYHLLEQLSQSKTCQDRKLRGFNPLAPEDAKIFAAVSRGEHALMGFRNGHLARQLYPSVSDHAAKRRISARVSRILQRLRAQGLIAKIPRTRRYRITLKGHRLMGAVLHLQKEYMPKLLKAA